MMYYPLYFYKKADMDTNGVGFHKARLGKVGRLFSHVRLEYLDSRNNVTFSMRCPIRRKDKALARSVVGKAFYCRELADRFWIIYDWEWKD